MKKHEEMILAFYYHIPVSEQNRLLTCPSYLGVFIDSLAANVEKLYILMHQSNNAELKEADYFLKSKNIVWINLGLKTPVWHRAIFHKRFLKKALEEVSDAQIMLVRSPSPLAPYFRKYLKGQKLVYMIVGDYLESVAQWKIKNIREYFELMYLRYNDYSFRNAMKDTDLLVNSPALFNKYKGIGKSIHLIRTTTLSENDFFKREDTCKNNTVQLLFTGRIDPLKGLFELVEAIAKLREENYNIVLNIVGWESEANSPVEKGLRKLSEQLKIDQFVVFHGRKSVGEELNKMYRIADIYVLPSHEEGFPRTIWEAMANSLPVITTKVGGIPSYLKDKESAILIDPKDVNQIVQSVIDLMNSSECRKLLIHNGLLLAKENTLEKQTEKLIKTIIQPE